MNNDLWTKEIMSLKVPNVSQKDVTKILILFYLIEYHKINCTIDIRNVSKYIYEFYIDNPDISKYNPNSVIRNINKYNIEDIIQITRIALYDWKNDFPNGCLKFNDNELYIQIDDVNERMYTTSLMIAKMLYKKATMDEWNYSPSLVELQKMTSYDLDYLNGTRLKNRVLEDMDYCCCCDSTGDLYIVNISEEDRLISNPYNYVTVCIEHYKLFKDGYYSFTKNGQIVINKEHPLINKNMHISQRIMKDRKKEVE